MKNIPKTCGECIFFKDAETEFGKKHGGCSCMAQGISRVTYSFKNPLDNPMPPVFNCIYMEDNIVFKGLSKERKDSYRSERAILLKSAKSV